MSEPDLRLVDATDEAICGAPTGDGSPCRRPAGENGRCWEPTHNPGGVADTDELPDPPNHLDKLGREEWLKRASELYRGGVLDQIDLGLLEQACEMYEGRRQCQRAVSENGQLVPGRGESVKKNPATAKQLEYAREYRLCMKQLREQVEAAEPESDDDEYDPLLDY